MSCEQAELLFSCFPHIVARINVDLLPGRASVQSLFQQQHTHSQNTCFCFPPAPAWHRQLQSSVSQTDILLWRHTIKWTPSQKATDFKITQTIYLLKKRKINKTRITGEFLGHKLMILLSLWVWFPCLSHRYKKAEWEENINSATWHWTADWFHHWDSFPPTGLLHT